MELNVCILHRNIKSCHSWAHTLCWSLAIEHYDFIIFSLNTHTYIYIHTSHFWFALFFSVNLTHSHQGWPISLPCTAVKLQLQQPVPAWETFIHLNRWIQLRLNRLAGNRNAKLLFLNMFGKLYTAFFKHCPFLSWALGIPVAHLPACTEFWKPWGSAPFSSVFLFPVLWVEYSSLIRLCFLSSATSCQLWTHPVNLVFMSLTTLFSSSILSDSVDNFQFLSVSHLFSQA